MANATPKRIQRRRTKGWRMPEGAVTVARPSIFGNPFKVSDMVAMCQAGLLPAGETPRQAAVRYFREWLEGKAIVGQFAEVVPPPSAHNIRDHLRGKDLACWCRLDQPCHADVLLEIANAH